MKDKIIMFIIGILVGAIISTGAFYIYTTTAGKCDCSNQNIQMNGGQPPEMPSGQNSENGQPPEKPDGEMGQLPEMPNGEMGQPPEKPSDSNNQNNNTQDNN